MTSLTNTQSEKHLSRSLQEHLQLGGRLQQRLDARHEAGDLGEIRPGHQLRVQRQGAGVVARLHQLHQLVEGAQRVVGELGAGRRKTKNKVKVPKLGCVTPTKNRCFSGFDAIFRHITAQFTDRTT